MLYIYSLYVTILCLIQLDWCVFLLLIETTLYRFQAKKKSKSLFSLCSTFSDLQIFLICGFFPHDPNNDAFLDQDILTPVTASSNEMTDFFIMLTWATTMQFSGNNESIHRIILDIKWSRSCLCSLQLHFLPFAGHHSCTAHSLLRVSHRPVQRTVS